MKNIIHCPKCGCEINVHHTLHAEIEQEVQNKFKMQYKEVNADFEAKKNEIKLLQERVDAEREAINNTIQQAVTDRLKLEKLTLEKSIRQLIDDEKSEQINAYQKQLNEKVQEVKAMNKLKAELERSNREKATLKEELEAENEIKLSRLLAEEKKRIKAESDSKSELRLHEREIVIQQLKDQLKIAQQKAEQGSMQLQGEAQEVAIEAYLKVQYPNDMVEEVKKGARGADCMQIVHNSMNVPVGGIYYESKRTKEFQPSWIEKFKQDLRQRNANFGVIVTDAYPKGMERMGIIKGVWICSYNEFKGLSFVLREATLLLYEASKNQDNKVTKMDFLYKFLTSNEFRLQVEGIVEGLAQFQNDLQKERRSIESIWKQREKNIQAVLLNTIHMYSSIRSIAGSAIPAIKQLELPEQ